MRPYQVLIIQVIVVLGVMVLKMQFSVISRTLIRNGGSYPSAEMLSAYFTIPANRVEQEKVFNEQTSSTQKIFKDVRFL